MLGFDRHAARYVWTTLFLLFGAWLLYRIRDTLFIFVLALLFAYLLWPVVNLLARRLPGRSRVPALTLVYLALVGVLIVLGMVIGARIVRDANALAARLPDILAKLHPPSPPATPPAGPGESALRAEIEGQLASHSQQLLAMLPGAALGVMARARSLIFVVLVPILAFFFLKDAGELRLSILNLLGEGSRRNQVVAIAGDLHLLLAQYMRALVLLGLVAATAYGIFFTLIGVPYAALLAAIAFPLEFIPMVGPLAEALLCCWWRV